MGEGRVVNRARGAVVRRREIGLAVGAGLCSAREGYPGEDAGEKCGGVKTPPYRVGEPERLPGEGQCIRSCYTKKEADPP